MNAPERTSSFLLDEDTGEVKIVYKQDTKASSGFSNGDNGESKTMVSPLIDCLGWNIIVSNAESVCATTDALISVPSVFFLNF